MSTFQTGKKRIPVHTTYPFFFGHFHWCWPGARSINNHDDAYFFSVRRPCRKVRNACVDVSTPWHPSVVFQGNLGRRYDAFGILWRAWSSQYRLTRDRAPSRKRRRNDLTYTWLRLRQSVTLERGRNRYAQIDQLTNACCVPWWRQHPHIPGIAS